MKNQLASSEEYEIFWLLHQLNIGLIRSRRRELRKYGISPIHAAVLFAIKVIGESVTPAKISWWVFREPNTISALLDRMEKKGLLKKTKDLDRKNLIRVTLTEKGERAYRQSIKRVSLRRIIFSLPKEEREQLKSYLGTLMDKTLKELRIDRKLPFPLPCKSSAKMAKF